MRLTMHLDFMSRAPSGDAPARHEEVVLCFGKSLALWLRDHGEALSKIIDPDAMEALQDAARETALSGAGLPVADWASVRRAQAAAKEGA